MRNTYDAAETLERQIHRVERAEAILRARITRLKFLIEQALSEQPMREEEAPWGLKPGHREH